MSLLSFFQRIKRDGFVCGFGWKPKVKKEVENLCNAFNALTPPPKPPEIGCIAKSILKDLENFENWSRLQKLNDGDVWRFKSQTKSYTLQLFDDYDFYWLKIMGIDDVFNEDETRAISLCLINFNKLTEQKVENERQSKNKEILEKLFPECAGRI